LLLLDALKRRAEALVRHDVGLFDLPNLVEDGVGQVGTVVLDGDGAVGVIVDPDLLAA